MKCHLLISFLCIASYAYSQERPGIRTHLSFEYGFQVVQGDMANTFGNNFNLGSQFEVLHRQTLWLVGIKGYFLFGNTVKMDVLDNIRTQDGLIIGNDRAPASVDLRERGFFLGGYVGKVLPFSAKTPESGLKLSVGGGMLQHKIRVQDNTQSVPQVTEEYSYGYDRLSNGPALYGFVGYQHLDPQGRINFIGGFDLTWGGTKSRRAQDFSTMSNSTETQSALLLGVRIGLLLPITRGIQEGPVYR